MDDDKAKKEKLIQDVIAFSESALPRVRSRDEYAAMVLKFIVDECEKRSVQLDGEVFTAIKDSLTNVMKSLQAQAYVAMNRNQPKVLN
jgi:hypothetical protein